MRAIVTAVLLAMVLTACGTTPGTSVTIGPGDTGRPADAAPTGGGSAGSVGSGEILCPHDDAANPAVLDTPDCPGRGEPPAEPPSEPTAVTVLPRPEGLTDVHPVPWERARARGRQVTVRWWSGVEPCTVLHSVDVTETRRRIVVTVREGAQPDAGACIAIALAKRATAELSAPVGDRAIVDGAAPAKDGAEG